MLILLVLTRYLVHLMWYTGKDPDTTVIPLLTSAGDFLGTVFLLAIFNILSLAGDSSAQTPPVAAASGLTNAYMEVTTIPGVELINL